jgi:hypothetical protein
MTMETTMTPLLAFAAQAEAFAAAAASFLEDDQNKLALLKGSSPGGLNAYAVLTQILPGLAGQLREQDRIVNPPPPPAPMVPPGFKLVPIDEGGETPANDET